MTIKQILTEGTNTLKEYNANSPKLDAEILLSYVLNKSRVYLFSNDNQQITIDEINKYKELVERRLNSEPIAYIVGKKEFYGLDFIVNQDVLIPRPETEHLVEYIISIIEKDSIMLDICTGSGCIPIAVRYNSSYSVITHLSDVSVSALRIAEKNYQQIFKEQPISFVSDIFKSIPIENRYDVISANPPYIKSYVINELKSNVKDYEPLIALDGGIDGLKYYKEILSNAYPFLKKSGRLVLEIDDYVYKDILVYLTSSSVLNQYDKSSLEVIKDYAGKNRVLVLNKAII